ncbi:hypothetical protein V502_11053 [Pseudogymnoascus sp. VKM F-4520 (FW-2644)]|nr:hypothetical protein V502_11053 [Pseudogymnoascus sp. VKM F-4520 (FW-2644)]
MTPPHPRRSLKTTSSSPMTPRSAASASTLDTISMTPHKLRKGATFHNPPSPVSDHFVVPCLPRRSQTSLEDVVEAHKRRVALTLGDIDRGLSAVDLGAPHPTTQNFRDDSLPVPQGFLNHTVDTNRCESRSTMSPIASQSDFSIGGRSLRPRRHNRRPSTHHASDSGLGSSIMSASSEKRGVTAAGGLTCLTDEQGAKSTVSASAITRSAAPHRSSPDTQPRLSERATNRIHEFILKPLLATPSLKDFHPIVADCPRRINEKEIVCLRDLEKTLMFMAPVSDIHNDDDAVRAFTHWFSSRLKEHSKTAKLYLEFCVTSIRCIQATVEFLNEREQTRPNDRPYTSGYFIDLVDQIRNYAQSVQASREKEEGETDDMDVQPYVTLPQIEASALSVPTKTLRIESSGARVHSRKYKKTAADHPRSRSEQIKLYGGVAKNGRPAELVRVKNDGTAISLATGKQIKMESIEDDEKNGVMMKRSLSQELDDEESIMRSMARRKRSATAEIQAKKCSEPGCTKEFKRSCDLTKHEKTHSRPWKCQEPLCKYHDYGWPTEKELDRHVNDKHSATPRLFKCQFPPCPYQSKRESNCKQHMEKSHNWVYVRSKNNGKNRDQAPAQQQNALPTPQTTTIRTPDSEAQLSSPDEMNWEMDAGNDANGANFNDVFHRSPLDFPTYPADFSYTPDQTLHNNNYTLSPADSHLHSLPSSTTSPYIDTSDLFLDDVAANFGPAFAPSGNDFTLYEDLYSARVNIPHQLPTPDPAIFARSYEPSYACVDAVTPARAQGVQQLSPVGQGNTMLYTPDSSCETFEALMPGRQHADNNHNLGNQFSDFQLFGSTAQTHGGHGQGQTALFGEVAALGGHAQQGEGGNSASQEYFMAFYEANGGGMGGATGGEWGGDEGFDGKWGGL